MKRKQTLINFVLGGTVLVSVVVFLSLISGVVSAVSQWSQTDWSGGSGQQAWSTSNKYESGTNVNSATDGQISLSNNPNYESRGGWWSTSYQYRQKLTFDNSAQTENLANFPVLIKLTANNFDFTRTQTDGDDIRFVDANDATPLSYEVESWNATTKEAYVWVKVPQVDGSSTADFIYLYYGNPTATNGENIAGAWDTNFTMVQHLNETSGAHQDSTVNANHATTTNVTNQGVATAKVGGADEFNGTGNWLNFSTRSAIFNPSSFSISFWFNSDTTSSNLSLFNMGPTNADGWGAESEVFCIRTSSAYVDCGYSGMSDFGVWTSMTAGEYYWLTLTFDGSTGNLYKNGQLAMSDPVTNPIDVTTWTNNLVVGSTQTGGLPRYFDGKIDEFRVSNTSRSADWIAAQYASMNDTFITYDNADRIPWQSFDWQYRKTLTFDYSGQTENLVDFPVLISLDATNFDFSLTQFDGDDIRFVDSDNVTTLSHEVESWYAGSETAFIWVKVPQIDGSSSTDFIYLYYGNTTVGNGEDVANVWSEGYEGVWHFAETSGQHLDSTGKGYNSTSVDVTQQGAAVGKIGPGDQFVAASADDVQVAGFPQLATDFSVSAWFKPSTTASSGFFVSMGRDWPQSGWNFVYKSDEYYQTWFRNNGNNWAGSSLLDPNIWYWITTTFGSDYTRFYVDGQLVAEIVNNGDVQYLYAETLTFGEMSYWSGLFNYDGYLDEVAISDTTRSADWIAAQYASMNGGFVTYGTQTSVSGTYSPTWWDSDWQYRKKITFDNAGQAENLTDFPVLVKLNSSRVDFAKTQNGGEDVRFIDANNVTLLPHEIEQWDESSNSFVWVKVPQIDASSTEDYMWMYYGNTTALDGQDGPNVWDSNFRMVHHMDEASGGLVDSTIGGYDPGAGGASFQYAKQGLVGKSIEFDDSGHFLFSDADEVDFNFGNTEFTLEILLKPGENSSNMAPIARNGYSAGWALRLWGDSETKTPSFWLRGTSGISVWDTSTVTNVNEWVYLAIPVTTSTTVATDNQFDIYSNGQIVKSSGVPSWPYKVPVPGGDNQFAIGFRPTVNDVYWGDIDEVRISTVRRSADWIAAQYASMNDTFNTFGSVEGQYEANGMLTSSIFDSGYGSDWGVISWTQSGGGTVAVKVRTSNSSTLAGAASFDSCNAVTNGTDISVNNCVTDGDQYVQYQITLGAGSTPVIEEISIGYANVPTPTPTPLPTGVPTPTVTPVPTATPIPTPTPIPDTTPPDLSLKKIGGITYDSRYNIYYYTGTKPLFYGTGEIGAQVSLNVNGTNHSYTPTINPNGEWSIPNYTFSVGSHQVLFTATDLSGNKTVLKFTLVVDPTGMLFPENIQNLLYSQSSAQEATPTVTPSVSVAPTTTPTNAPDQNEETKDGPKEQTGNSVTVKLTTTNGKPLAGVSVTLASDPQTVVTDKNGVATFANVPPGEHHLSFEYGGEKVTRTLSLLNDDQDYHIDVTVNGGEPTIPWWVWVIGFILMSVIAIMVYGRWKKNDPITTLPIVEEHQGDGSENETASSP